MLSKILDSDIYKRVTKHGKLRKIIKNPHQGNVLVLIQEDSHSFSLYRFFTIGSTIQVSADLINTDLYTLFDDLMEKLADNQENLIIDF